MTKVKVIKDVIIYDGNRTYGLGAVFDYSGGEEAVEKLVKLGYVEKADAPPVTLSKTEREKMKEEAVKKGLGTTEEVAKLSDRELKELFKAAR